MKIGSLFSGIGGLELGLEWAGVGHTIWQVEKEPFCQKVLAKHWPDAKRYEDVYTVGSHNLESVDLICGGFPCQPFSGASHGRKTAVDLWPEMRRVVCSIRPRFVVAENVELFPIAYATQELTSDGYTCGILHLPAALVGAPHERSRWFLVGDSNPNSKPTQPIDAKVALMSTLPGCVSWETEPASLGMDDGVPDRLDRLRALGNAVVPQCAFVIGQVIKTLQERL